MKTQHKILYISPTLLDSFNNLLSAETSWQKYWGDSEDPSISLQDYEDKCFKELIDRINKVTSEHTEAASKGTAFNDIVDTLIHNKKCGRTKLNRIYDGQDVVGIKAEVDGFTFDFDYGFCKAVANKFKGSVSQLLVSADIHTRYGIVNLYGFIDELKEDVVFDLKTTSMYEFGKYSKYMQRFVYPYCLIESGKMDSIREFEFTAYTLNKSGLITGKEFREIYSYNHEEAKNHITDVCERFYEFVNSNRDLITTDYIFTERSHKH